MTGREHCAVFSSTLFSQRPADWIQETLCFSDPLLYCSYLSCTQTQQTGAPPPPDMHPIKEQTGKLQK